MYEYEELIENEEEYIENVSEITDTISTLRDSPETIVTSESETNSSDDSVTSMTESEIYIENIIDEISELEEYFMDEEKEDGKYYIGLSGLENHSLDFLLMTAVRPITFYKYPYYFILKFLDEFSLFVIENLVINILKVVKNSERNCVIIKTFWLKIVQRKWKKVFAEKKKTIQQMKSYNWLRYREIYGKNPNGNYIPSLRGMLSNLKN